MNILIADDEENIRNGIEKRIIRTGLQPINIVVASDGLEANRILETIDIDLAFIDINMPFINGLEVIQSYHDKGVLFVIVSGYDSFEYARKALQYGVFRYILKPIDKNEFEEVLFAAKEKLQLNMIETKHSDDLNRIIKIINANFSNDGFSLESCSELTGISKRQISKVLNSELNQTFTDLLNQMRIDHAIKLMNEQEKLRLADIALACGFINQQYFSVVFKKITGKTPLAYLKEKQ